MQGERRHAWLWKFVLSDRKRVGSVIEQLLAQADHLVDVSITNALELSALDDIDYFE